MKYKFNCSKKLNIFTCVIEMIHSFFYNYLIGNYNAFQQVVSINVNTCDNTNEVYAVKNFKHATFNHKSI